MQTSCLGLLIGALSQGELNGCRLRHDSWKNKSSATTKERHRALGIESPQNGFRIERWHDVIHINTVFSVVVDNTLAGGLLRQPAGAMRKSSSYQTRA